MTTIVADREMGYMAADFMVTSNDGEYSIKCESKIVEVDVGGDLYLVGLAGLEGPGLLFLDWFENGDWDEPPDPIYDIAEEDDFSVLVLGPEGLEIADKFMRLEPVLNRWYGIGTGGPVAWAILESGAGRMPAMSTAVRLDGGSGFGFEVKYLDGTYEDYSE